MQGIITYLRIANYHYYHLAWVMSVMFLVMFNATTGYCQPGNSINPIALNYHLSDTSAEHPEPGDDYEEISITLNVSRIGSLEIPAIIHGPTIYLSVKDLFDFLKIRNFVSPDFDLVQGFFIYQKDNYFIDKTNNRIVYRHNAVELNSGDLVRTETNLYLKSDYFGQIFGLECVFDFRSLTVTLHTKLELPAIREMQQELMRRNISQLKGEKKADTVIRRDYSFFHVGMADWSVISTQETKGNDNVRANIGIGAIVAGGEVNLSLNYNSDETNWRQQFYQWRHVNNDRAALRQVTAGKIYAQSTSSIYAPVIGIQFTNTSTTYRRSFGTYTLSNTTEPGWLVELYMNNVLVDYKNADASGFYTFEVPMVYGNSVVKLRFYGPWGEERTSEKYISVPFNFIPLNQFEYNLTAGMVEGDQKNLYSRANFNYGLSRRVTIGGGVEYLSSVSTGKSMPFLNASLRMGSHMLLSGEHTYGVSSKGVISYRLPSNLQFDLNYIRYVKNQTAVMSNFLEEKKVVLSMPLRAKKLTAFTRFTLNQFTLPYSPVTLPKNEKKYTSAEFLLSAVVYGVSSNLTTYAVTSNPGNPLVYTNFSLNIRLPGGIRFTPQAQYEYKQKSVSMVKGEIEKRLSNRGFVNIGYEKALVNNNISSVTIGLRYNFSFAQTFFSASTRRNSIATTQSARGSLMYDDKTNYLGANNQTNVGKGGIIVLPYLDLNCNDRRDLDEPKVLGVNLRINGGRLEQNNRDTTLRITGLEAYRNYFIELDKSNFENVAWQLKKQTISITIEPNNFKLIEVPIAVVGEVSGTVYQDSLKGRNGIGRIIVNFYNADSILVGRTVTEADGYFSFMGLSPGKYSAQVDNTQLQKLQMNASSSMSFIIRSNRDGDVSEGLEFVMQRITAQ